MKFKQIDPRRAVIGIATLTALLAGCSAYAPYLGKDSAKVRMVVSDRNAVGGVTTHIGKVENGQCEKALLVSNVLPPDGTTKYTRNAAPNSVGTLPRSRRVGMVDSPTMSDYNFTEVAVVPGRYVMQFYYKGLIRSCTLSPMLDLKARHQYVLDFSFDQETGACTVNGTELEQRGDQDLWQPITLSAGPEC